MASWFIPPIVVPIGVVVMILAFAIYHAFAHNPPRMQSVAIEWSASPPPARRPHDGGGA